MEMALSLSLLSTYIRTYVCTLGCALYKIIINVIKSRLDVKNKICQLLGMWSKFVHIQGSPQADMRGMGRVCDHIN